MLQALDFTFKLLQKNLSAEYFPFYISFYTQNRFWTKQLQHAELIERFYIEAGWCINFPPNIMNLLLHKLIINRQLFFNDLKRWNLQNRCDLWHADLPEILLRNCSWSRSGTRLPPFKIRRNININQQGKWCKFSTLTK